MQLSDPIVVTLELAAVFERLGVEYLVGGSLASSVYGRPRATNDVDLVAALAGCHVDAFVHALTGDYYVDADMIRDALARQASFNVIHLARMFKADVFIMKSDEYAREEMARRVSCQIGEDAASVVHVASPEDTVLQKLDWYRRGDEISDRQWKDLIGVLEVQRGRLDVAYMNRWAPHLGVADLLERAILEVDPPATSPQ